MGSLALASAVLAVGSDAAAQARDSATFVVRLGRDTVAVEQYRLVGNRLEAISVTRSPRTTVRRYLALLGPDGSVTQWASGGADSALTPTPAPGGAIPLAGPFQVPWELALRRAMREDGDSVAIPMLIGESVRPTAFRAFAPGAFEFANQFDARVVARVDRWGRVLGLDAGGGNTVSRVPWFDVHLAAQEFGRRDARGTGLGALSPRDTTRATVGGATILIAYGRPSLRGRDLRLLAPHDQVWRTGANDATHFRTDRTLQIDDYTVPAGTYTLFTIPGDEEWTLILNRQTGQSGTEYDETRDLVRVPLRVERAPHTERFTIDVATDANSGALILRWGTVSASVPFRLAG